MALHPIFQEILDNFEATALGLPQEELAEEPDKFLICDNCGEEAGTEPESGVDVCDNCGIVESHTHYEDVEGNYYVS